MKKKRVTLFTMIALTTLCWSFETRFVTAVDGLNIRDQSSISGKIVGRMPFGVEVKILYTNEQVVEINKHIGHWSNVVWNGINGWIFDYYTKAQIDIFDKLKYKIYKDNPAISLNGNIERLEETFRVLDVFHDYYYVTCKAYFPDGMLMYDDYYFVYAIRGTDIIEVQKHSNWMFKKLLLADINNDSYVDIVTWEGGNIYPPRVYIYLGSPDPIKCKKTISSGILFDDEEENNYYIVEDFYYDHYRETYVIVNTKYNSKTDYRLIRYFYFDKDNETMVQF